MEMSVFSIVIRIYYIYWSVVVFYLNVCDLLEIIDCDF